MPGCGPCGTSCKPTKQLAAAKKKPTAVKKTVKPKAGLGATGRTSTGGGCCCSKAGGCCGPQKKSPLNSRRSSCYQGRRNDCSNYTDSSDCSCSDCVSDGYDSTSDSYTDDSYSSDERCRCRSGCKR